MISFKYIKWGNLFQEKMGKEKGSLCKANQIELNVRELGHGLIGEEVTTRTFFNGTYWALHSL